MGTFGPWQNGPYLRNALKLSKWNNIRIDANNVFSPIREEECLRRPIKKLVWTMSFVAPVTCASLICSQAPRAPNFLLSPPFSNPCHCSEHRTLSKTNAQKLQIHSLILLQIKKTTNYEFCKVIKSISIYKYMYIIFLGWQWVSENFELKKTALKRRDLTPIGASTTGPAARSRRGLRPSCGTWPGAWLLSPRTSRWRNTWKQMKQVKNYTKLFTCHHPSKRSIEGNVCWRNNGV